MDLIEARAFHLAELRRLRGHAADHPTQRLYGMYERRHLEYLALRGNLPALDQLNQFTVAGCQMWIRDEHARGSRNGRSAELSYVRIMRIWSRFLWRRRIIPVDFMAGMEVPRLPKILRHAFTSSQARALCAVIAAGPQTARNRAIVAILADTGCRVGELCGLEVSDVLTSDYTPRGAILFRHTKGGTPRDVLVTQSVTVAVCAWLQVRQSPERALFVTPQGHAITPRYIRQLHVTWGLRANVSPCYPHLWRHTAATEALAEGVPENSIRDRLGHVSPEVLHDYLHQSDRTRAQAAERASLVTKWGL